VCHPTGQALVALSMHHKPPEPASMAAQDIQKHLKDVSEKSLRQYKIWIGVSLACLHAKVMVESDTMR
jgi:hypothetical protein